MSGERLSVNLTSEIVLLSAETFPFGTSKIDVDCPKINHRKVTKAETAYNSFRT